ncbi:hypothetical protein BDZ89DRAFT_808021 [Hymenopellis radicata]|nr:hypothetical protein BDZ89DRAFT_808021 [Hymenopellis radicata]
MDRIPYDPALERCPDFAGPKHQRARAYLIADAALADITTDEEAAQHLRDEWTTENNEQRTLYQQQVEADKAVEEQRVAQEQDARRLQSEEKKKKEEEDLKEKEKARAVLHPIDRSKGIGAAQVRLHPYARQKMERREQFPLWYCLSTACRDAAEEARLITDDTFFDITRSSDGKLAFLPTSSARPSKNAIPDVLLTWAQLLEARTLFLQSLHLGNFPQSHVAMFSEFYANMEMHAYAKQEVGRLALVRYHALALEDWYDRNRQGDPFNLALIDEARLRECKEDIRDKKGRTQDTVFERKMSEVDVLKRRLESLMSSPSHSLPQSPRKRQRSDSMTNHPPVSPSPQKRHASKESFAQSFRKADPDQATDHPSRCPLCLGCFRHNIRTCERTVLWDDKTPARCKRNERGHLENPAGQELCSNWQRPNGCTDNRHPSKHECSGCGDHGHGAQVCSLGPK